MAGRPVTALRAAAGAALIAVLLACTPAGQWRSLTIAGTPLAASFPCKPDSHARDVPLAGRTRHLTLQACTDRDTLYAIGWAPVADPTEVGAVLAALRAAAVANLGAGPAQVSAFGFAGATPQAQAGRQALLGRAADGRPLKAEVAIFAVGLTAFQATVIGAAPPAEAVALFFGGIGLANQAAPGVAR